MYSQRTRNIIIGSVTAAVAIVVLLILGITLYATTDILKSNDTLFYKYVGQTLDSLKYVENSQLTEIENLKAEKAYSIDGNLSYGETVLNANPANAQVEFQIVQNDSQKEGYGRFNLISNKQAIFNVEYAKSNDIIALKSPEIVNAYLGVRNEYLQQFARRLGVTNTSVIPDSIKEIKLNELLNITEEQKEHIKNTYLRVLQRNIDKSKFTKEKGLAVSRDGENYNTTAYHLNLTSEELRRVELELLQTLKEDDTTLNIIVEKLKMFGLNNITTNTVKLQIQNLITSINNTSINPNAVGINIMLYTTGGRIVTTEIIYKNSIKCTVFGSSTENESKRYLLIENLNVDTEFEKLEINESEVRNGLESSYNIKVNVNDTTQVKATITNKGGATENKLISTGNIEIDGQNKTQIIGFTSQMTFNNNADLNIIQLNKNNCGILNDYSEEQLRALVDAVAQRTIEVVNQKLRIIGVIRNQNN